MARMLFHCKHGADDPERAIVPFIAANVAAASGQEAVVLLTIDGAWLCRRGGIRDETGSGRCRSCIARPGWAAG